MATPPSSSVSSSSAGSESPPHRHSERAKQVCLNCRIRKKQCDKAFPSCSYCAQRQIICCYSTAKHSVDVQLNLGPSLQSYALLVSTLADKPIPHFLPRSSRQPTLDETLSLQVSRLLRSTNRSCEEVCARFFEGVHRWLPVLSQRRFFEQLQSSCDATLSVLLATMCLVTYHPFQSSTIEADRESLYLTVKMLYAHVQAVIPVSMRLVQSHLLLTVYEYVQGRNSAAFVSVGTCARMACALNIDSSTQEEEERNLYWAIAIMDRMIACELAPMKQPLVTQFPAIDTRLPIESVHGLELYGEDIPVLSDMSRRGLDGYARVAQAAYLLDQILGHESLHDKAVLEDSWRQLDAELQAFIKLVVQDQIDKEGWGRLSRPFYCGPISLAIRSLFLLHCQKSNRRSSIRNEYWEKISQSALNTAAQMAIDVAHTHCDRTSDENIDTYPPSFSYVLRSGVRYLKLNPTRPGCIEDLDALHKMLRHLRLRWSIVDS